jgi:N-acetylmuramoyl-L-alanine amidase
MSVIKYTEKELELLARLMRAEAESEGELGMLMVGNVGVNRVRANCLDFKDITCISDMINQHPGGFESTLYSYFYQAPRQIDKKLAQRVLNGEVFHPASRALWFYNSYGEDCMAQWWNQWNSGRYKSHCFYTPVESYNCY